MSRTIQDLRQLGALSKNSRAIAVAHWDGLVEIAKFDGRYLNMPRVLSKWIAPLKFIAALAICIGICFE
jgi:hypothetical protein